MRSDHRFTHVALENSDSPPFAYLHTSVQLGPPTTLTAVIPKSTTPGPSDADGAGNTSTLLPVRGHEKVPTGGQKSPRWWPV